LIGPGYTPYVTNLLNGDHIFHPIMGSQRVEIITHITPNAFEGRPAIVKLALSLASETANSCPTCEPGRLKIPFTVRLSEARGATFPDPRTGGFGPLFSAALLLAAALLILAMRDRSVSPILWMSLIFLIGSVVINPEAWWARYAPHLWLVPLTVAAFLQPFALSRLARAVRFALLAVLIVNAAFMAIVASGYALLSTHKARAQVAAFARMGPLYVRDSPWVGALQRLRDGGAAYAYNDYREPDCSAIITVLRSQLDVCVPAVSSAAITPK
jgi:hypothetical protein